MRLYEEGAWLHGRVKLQVRWPVGGVGVAAWGEMGLYEEGAWLHGRVKLQVRMEGWG